jgi:Leucine-rich repeat (LRR) protein
MMAFKYHVLIVIISFQIVLTFVINYAGSNQTPQSQIEALQDLYYNTTGSHWLWRYPLSEYGNIWNFSGLINPCGDNWQGITCDVIDGGIVSISLEAYGLNGTIPLSIINLPQLETLILKNNHVFGKIPQTFCQMPSLNYLYLGINALTGTIPPCLTQTGYLSYLSLHINYLMGTLPPFTESSGRNMTYLSMTANFFTGSIPDSYIFLTNLSSFYVSYNLLTGTLDTLPHMISLRRFSVADNLFYCTIPATIGYLENAEYIYLQGNSLYGNIPEVGSNFSKLIYFSVYDNYLSGVLPLSMGKWNRVQVAALDGNLLSGSLPELFSNWTFLQQLTVYSNCFTGTLPSAISSLEYLTILLLQQNSFEGSPGPAFNRTKQLSLQTIDLSTNHFTGTLPEDLFGYRLTSFSAFQTCFTGSIPTAICDSSALETLSLDGLTSYCSIPVWPGIPGSPKYARRVQGTIPNCMWTDLVNITTLQISGNGLTGTIPDQDSYGNLTSLDLSYNSMTGRIPFTLQSWHLLENLNLQSNKFIGEITGIGLLSYSNQLQAVTAELTLANNRLSGIIPRTIEYTRTINIVEGNLFSCSNKHQPPKYDAQSNNFVCASNLLDMSLYLFLAIGSLFTLLLMIALIVIYRYFLFSTTVLSATFEFYCFIHDYDKLESSLQKLKDSQNLSRIDSIKIFLLSILWWRSRVALLINSDLKEKAHDVLNLVQFLKTLRSLRRLTIVLMMIIVTIGIPLFSILKDYYGTYSIQYRWRISGVFLSGDIAASCLLLFWAVVLAITVWWIKRSIPEVIDKPYYLAALQSLSASDESAVVSASGVEDNSTNEKELSTGSKSLSIIKGIRSTLGQSLKRSSVAIGAALSYVSRVSMWISIGALALNVLVVLTMKSGFIYLLVSSDTSFGIKVLIEVCLAGLDVVWTAILVPSLITNLPKKRSTSRMLLKAAMLYFNSVIAPCVVIAVADESCFEGMFVKYQAETESFTFDYCNTYDNKNSLTCLDPSSWQSSTLYTPLFYYNYNCYSTVVVEYVPVFLLSYSVLSLLIPLVTAFLITREVRWKILDLFPGVYFLNVDISSSAVNNSTISELHQSLSPINDSSDLSTANCIPFVRNDEEINQAPQERNKESDSTTVRTTDHAWHDQSPLSSISFDREKGSRSLLSFEKNLSAISPESSTRQQIIFPQYILASVLHHLLVMLTFAVMCPALAVAVALVISSATLTWEVLIGRWMVQDNALRKIFDHANLSHQYSLSCRDPDILPFIGPFTKKLDGLCVEVCCGPTKCYGLLAFGSAVFFACVTVDIAGDKNGWEKSIWFAGVVFGFALACYCYCNYRHIGNFSMRQFSRLKSQTTLYQYSYDDQKNSSAYKSGGVVNQFEVNVEQERKSRLFSVRKSSAEITGILFIEPSRTTSKIELTEKIQNVVRQDADQNPKCHN